MTERVDREREGDALLEVVGNHHHRDPAPDDLGRRPPEPRHITLAKAARDTPVVRRLKDE